jgi:hypothetical protein
MARNEEGFAETYSKMSDDELLRIEADRVSLVEDAKHALDRETQKRQISMSDGPPEEETAAEAPEGPPAKSSSSRLWRLLVFFIWSAAGLTFVLTVFGQRLSGIAAEKFAEATTQMFLYSALAGWGITEVVAGRWLTIKRTMIIATVMYVLGFGWFAIKLLF